MVGLHDLITTGIANLPFELTINRVDLGPTTDMADVLAYGSELDGGFMIVGPGCYASGDELVSTFFGGVGTGDYFDDSGSV